MAEDSPCRRTPSTMPSSVHSMAQVYRILVKDAAIVAVIPESRIEPALRVAGIGIIQADGGQNTGHDLDAAVEFETVFGKRRQQENTDSTSSAARIQRGQFLRFRAARWTK